MRSTPRFALIRLGLALVLTSASLARAAVQRQHTWDHRVAAIFALAGLKTELLAH